MRHTGSGRIDFGSRLSGMADRKSNRMRGRFYRWFYSVVKHFLTFLIVTSGHFYNGSSRGGNYRELRQQPLAPVES